MATTHSCDTEQRIIDLPLTAIGLCELDLQVPDNADLATPGWYLLTIVDHQRRPSCATLGPARGAGLTRPVRLGEVSHRFGVT